MYAILRDIHDRPVMINFDHVVKIVPDDYPENGETKDGAELYFAVAKKNDLTSLHTVRVKETIDEIATLLARDSLFVAR